jgi:cytochrome b
MTPPACQLADRLAAPDSNRMGEGNDTGAPAVARAPLEGPVKVRVWDLFVRLFHWLVVGAIIVALVTSLIVPPTWITVHVISGTTAAALVAARIVWGFLGPPYARFESFVRHPREILPHLSSVKRGTGTHHLGHNPAGGYMILALLAAVTLITLSGTISLGG